MESVIGDDSAIRARIIAIIENKLNLEAPAPEADLFDTGVLDSVSFVDLLLNLESEFKIKCSLEDVDLENFRSVVSISRFIRGSSGTQGAAA